MALFDFLKPDCSGFPISRGATGSRVLEVQQALIANGQPITADGSWGPQSEAASRAVIGTPTVSCKQYRQLAGKGITPEKIDTGTQIFQSGISLIQALKQPAPAPQPVAPPPPPTSDSKGVYYAVGAGVLLLLLFFVILSRK